MMSSAIPSRLVTLGGAAVIAAALAVIVTVHIGPRSLSSGAPCCTVSVAASDPSKKRQPVPEFSLLDQQRETVTPASLAGEPFIADFIYTQCTSACPLITAKMIQVQRGLRNRRMRFVSFSVDPAHDTPEALAAYAHEWDGDDARWKLLATTNDDLDRLTRFGVLVVPMGGPDNTILHSDTFVLVDADGLMRGRYDSTSEAALGRLVDLATELSKPIDAAPAPNVDLLAALGCGGCHDRPRVAPPLVNLHGAQRVLADGRRIEIDDGYLRRSILDPSADVVAGYAVAMPTYRAQLDDGQLDAVVAALDMRVPAAGAPAEPAALVVDPVCSMQVRAGESAPHAQHAGKEYFFCSETCHASFVANPKKYLEKAAP